MTQTFNDAPGAPIRVAVVDDQGVIRAGLTMILDHEPDLTVVGEAGDGARALEMVATVRPDVVLMDIRMPVLDGIEATRRILAGGENGEKVPAVLVLTTFDDEEYVLGAIRAGASGFLLKDAGPDVLVSAVRTVHGGNSLVDPVVTNTLIAHCLELERALPKPVSELTATSAVTQPARDRWAPRLATLSDRERQILVGMARGLSNTDLAEHLVVSETTVKSHVSSVLAKLGLRNRVQAVVVAYETGVVAPGEQAAPDWRS
ncbi:response regulator [Kineosporia succinea]|uniref:DNA-binding NarL/FixJ family response regulator n=1 Tax=Kineosporia succinea TaxID=84632 RepID=A0ABT9P1T4_9ACTN|nr:response regulator transcription factor [Kineosporia succinea]MDP9826639.1 DNA-binding NarL/FixJ family response regulator [Kineosporia succinea]